MLDLLPRDLVVYTAQFCDRGAFVPLAGTNTAIRQALRRASHLKWNAYLCTLEVLRRVFDEKRNVLMHGPGGTGKSFTISAVKKVADENNIACAVTSTTGVSALRLPEGRTIHSFSGLKKASMSLAQLQQSLAAGSAISLHAAQNWRKTELLVIDEISMLGAGFLEKLHAVASAARGDPRFMGGVQVLFSGDFLQLPPVLDKYLFTTPVFARAGFLRVNFEVSFRHSQDRRYAGLLKRVRTGQQSAEDVEVLRGKVRERVPMVVAPFEWIPPRLFPVNRQVKLVNDECMQTLAATQPTRVVWCVDQFMRCEGRVWSAVPPQTVEKRRQAQFDHVSPPALRLITGAQYFVTYNFDFARGFVNGARVMFDGNRLVLRDGTSVTAEFSRITRAFALGRGYFLKRTQLALRPGYASSIHAAQGLTLDEAVVDLGRAVRGYQAYVALSRVRTLAGLTLLNFDPSSLRCHRGALEYLGLSKPAAAKSRKAKMHERLSEWFRKVKKRRTVGP